jgi:hypothetical protein
VAINDPSSFELEPLQITFGVQMSDSCSRINRCSQKGKAEMGGGMKKRRNNSPLTIGNNPTETKQTGLRQ